MYEWAYGWELSSLLYMVVLFKEIVAGSIWRK